MNKALKPVYSNLNENSCFNYFTVYIDVLVRLRRKILMPRCSNCKDTLCVAQRSYLRLPVTKENFSFSSGYFFDVVMLNFLDRES